MFPGSPSLMGVISANKQSSSTPGGYEPYLKGDLSSFTNPAYVWDLWKSAIGKGEGNMSPVYWGNMPGSAGLPSFTSLMADPYAVPEASKRASMEAADTAYNVARQRAGAAITSSGAGRGGVAMGTRAGIEASRAKTMADTVRNWEQWRQQVGDERMRMWLNWLQVYNQAHGSAKEREGKKSSWLETLLPIAAQAALAFATGGASLAGTALASTAFGAGGFPKMSSGKSLM